jgi:hypothetical protein
MKYFMMLTSVSALYRSELRFLPEKLRQERIQQTVLSVVKRIQDQVIRTASDNHTHYLFTLFCLEPNIAQEIYEIGGRSLFQPYGSKYKLSPSPLERLSYMIQPRPRCENKYGYELYQKWGYYNQPGYDKTKRFNEMIQKEWPIQPLEDVPTLYIQHFFELFNREFPDIHLSISSHRPSNGIFESECCPLYNVSW